MRLSDMHVVVTGAGRGIGRALALGASREGATVSCLDIDEAAAKAAAAEIIAQGGGAFGDRCDVTQRQEVERSLRAAASELGPISHLFANAGGAAGERTPFLDLSDEQWQRMLARNLTGNFICGQTYARYMSHRGQGNIVFIASVSAQAVFPGLVHYGAAKSALKQLVRGMAVELAASGIRVNAVAPGIVSTPGNAGVVKSPEAAAAALRAIPLGRKGAPEEIVGAVIHLASDESSYTTGAVLVVDGGYTLQ